MLSYYRYRKFAISRNILRYSLGQSGRTVVTEAHDPQYFMETPTLKAYAKPTYSSGLDVWYKLDYLQPSGSFKDRGIGNLIKHYIESGSVSKLISSSGGNAGYSVALIGKKLCVPVDVFVPTTTIPMMIEKIKKTGANVNVGGENWNAADAKAKEAVAKDPGAKYIPPFDNPLIWEGNSSIVDELKAFFGEIDRPDAIVLSVGGGGLLRGVQLGLQRVGWHDVSILAVETEGAASFAAAKDAGHVVKLDKIDTIASSLGALSVTPAVLDTSKTPDIKTYSFIVSDREAIQACADFADECRTLVEPACGAALAAVSQALILVDNSNASASVQEMASEMDDTMELRRPPRYEPRWKIQYPELRDVKSAVVVVCGGSVVSLKMMAQWKDRLGVY